MVKAAPPPGARFRGYQDILVDGAPCGAQHRPVGWSIPEPARIATEGAFRGTIGARGLLPGSVIVSDDAGQFRLGEHALYWAHGERLVHKLLPITDTQRQAIRADADPDLVTAGRSEDLVARSLFRTIG